MAALTWRDVAAPDFSGSLQGIGQFSRLLGNAFAGAEGAVGKFDNAQDEMANRAILERSLAMRDPASYEAALADGSLLGSEAARASASTLAGLDNRVGSLQNQALGKLNLESTTRQNDQSKAFDQVAADAVRASQARFAGKPDLALEAAINGRMGDIGARNALSLERGFETSETDGLANSNTRQNMDLGMRREGRDQTLFDRGTTEYTEARQVQRLADDAISQGYDASNIDQYMNANGITGNVKAALRGAIGGGVSGGSGGGGSSGASVVGDPSRVMNYEARAAGFSSVPDSVKTLGDASDYAKQVNRAGVASSAMGLYQIVGDTMRRVAPQVLGPNWRNEAYTPENQAKIATAIFNANRGSADALRKQWVSLSPAEAERVRQLPANQALAIIAQKESGATPAQLAGAGAISQNTAQRRVLAKDPTGFAGRIAKAQGQPDASLDEVAAQVAKETGADVGNVRKQLQSISGIMANNKVPAGWAVAGEIYKEGRVGTNWANEKLHSWFDTTGAGSGQIIDDNAVRGAIERYRSVTSGVNSERGGVGAAEQAKTAALTDYTAKYNRVMGLRTRAANGAPISPQVLGKAEADLALAEARTKDLVGGRIAEDEADATNTDLNYTGRGGGAPTRSGSPSPIVMPRDSDATDSLVGAAKLGPLGYGPAAIGLLAKAARSAGVTPTNKAVAKAVSHPPANMNQAQWAEALRRNPRLLLQPGGGQLDPSFAPFLRR